MEENETFNVVDVTYSLDTARLHTLLLRYFRNFGVCVHVICVCMYELCMYVCVCECEFMCVVSTCV